MEQVEKIEEEHTSASEATTEETKDQSQLSEESKTQIDYKAKLEEERRRREKAEAKLVELKQERKTAQTQEEVIDVDSRIAEIEQRMSEKLEQRVREIQFQSQEQRYESLVASVSSSDDEAELIKHILKNDINPSGDIERDVRRAKLLANEDKVITENSELKRALATRKTVGGISTTGQRLREDKPVWSAKDIKFAKQAGLDLSKLKKS